MGHSPLSGPVQEDYITTLQRDLPVAGEPELPRAFSRLLRATSLLEIAQKNEYPPADLVIESSFRTV